MLEASREVSRHSRTCVSDSSPRLPTRCGTGTFLNHGLASPSCVIHNQDRSPDFLPAPFSRQKRSMTQVSSAVKESSAAHGVMAEFVCHRINNDSSAGWFETTPHEPLSRQPSHVLPSLLSQLPFHSPDNLSSGKIAHWSCRSSPSHVSLSLPRALDKLGIWGYGDSGESS